MTGFGRLDISVRLPAWKNTPRTKQTAISSACSVPFRRASGLCAIGRYRKADAGPGNRPGAGLGRCRCKCWQSSGVIKAGRAVPRTDISDAVEYELPDDDRLSQLEAVMASERSARQSQPGASMPARRSWRPAPRPSLPLFRKGECPSAESGG